MKKAAIVAKCHDPYPKHYFVPKVQKIMGDCMWSYTIEFTDGESGLYFGNEPLEEGSLVVLECVGESPNKGTSQHNYFYKLAK